MNEVIEVHNSSNDIMNVAEVKDQLTAMHKILKDVMKRGIDKDYEVIPGTGGKKLTLLKPGAEKIMTAFRLGLEPIIEDVGDGYDFKYRITGRGFHIPTGNIVGYGIGECSTQEKKYAWRKALCEEEFDSFPESRRQLYFSKNYNSNKVDKIQQVRTNPADLSNTVLKMAKKRALIDFVLTATAASDIFTQDIDEDHIKEATSSGSRAKSYQMPQEKQEEHRYGNDDLPPEQPQNNNSNNVISEAQRKRLFAIFKSAEKDDRITKEEFNQALITICEVESTKEISRDKYNDICEHVENVNK